MSYSNTVTQEDLKNVLNEVLPTPRYGAVQTASWTANSSNANNVKLTDSIHLTAGTYVITVKFPNTSATLSTAIQYGTGTLLDSFCTGQGIAYSSHSYVISIPSEIDIFVATATSSSITYTYKDRGGLRAIQISESSISDNEADYIVEQGTSGIWTYRKWNSGISECWGNVTWSVTTWTQCGTSGIYYSSYSGRATYPTSLFTSTPIIATSSNGSYSDTWLGERKEHSATEAPEFFLLRVSSLTGTSTGSVHIQAKGTWK